MELKKSDKANLDKKRGLFIEIGFLIALGFVLLAFEWKVAPVVEEKEETQVEVAMDEEAIPITRQDEPPPPPPEPPKVTDILDIVADDVQVDTHIDINMEADLNAEINIAPAVFTETEIEEEDEVVIFAIVEHKPKFNGQDAEEAFRDWVNINTQYPAVAQENGISGRVFVEFAIDRTGKVVDVVILRGVDPLLDAEALRVIKLSPNWEPGMQRGKPVKVKYTFPFMFRLNN